LLLPLGFSLGDHLPDCASLLTIWVERNAFDGRRFPRTLVRIDSQAGEPIELVTPFPGTLVLRGLVRRRREWRFIGGRSRSGRIFRRRRRFRLFSHRISERPSVTAMTSGASLATSSESVSNELPDRARLSYGATERYRPGTAASG
jgi:hypothetical protein